MQNMAALCDLIINTHTVSGNPLIKQILGQNTGVQTTAFMHYIGQENSSHALRGFSLQAVTVQQHEEVPSTPFCYTCNSISDALESTHERSHQHCE